MLFDSHSHINEENFTPEQRQQIIDEIQACPQLEYVMILAAIFLALLWRQIIVRPTHGVMVQWEFIHMGLLR